MNANAKKIIEKALDLPPIERAELVEYIFESFNKEFRKEVDKQWIKESEDRINAYDQGKLKAIPAKDVFKRIDK
ncbi:MAG: addiction module protein [Elusimicrobia bacterium]|nr:addiction module protein [Candidatus Liberimonas magnetica]